MTWFDALLLAVLALSVSFAAIRGALREMATLLALAGAGLIAYIGVNPLLSLTGASGSFFAAVGLSVVVVVVTFAALYFGLHVALKRVTLDAQGVKIDRIAGAGFGLIRGLVLIGLGFLGYGYYLDADRRPDAVQNALLLPVAQASASVFKGLGPEETVVKKAPAAKDNDAPQDAAANGYGRNDRAGLEEIVTTVTTNDDLSSADTAPDGADPIADILTEENKGDE